MNEKVNVVEHESEGQGRFDNLENNIYMKDDVKTSLAQLPFFAKFLKVSGLYDQFIQTCPLKYISPNAPGVQDIMGTLVLSILAGHHRYAHISSIRFNEGHSGWLGMKKVVSEDAARRALQAIDEDEGLAWLDNQLRLSTKDVMNTDSWIMDTDTTVKSLYGKQEGRMVLSRPARRGTPLYYCHSCFMGTNRMALWVEVNQGSGLADDFTTSKSWDYYDSLSAGRKPSLIRGDIFSENESFLSSAEFRRVHYLMKLKVTGHVHKKQINKKYLTAKWVDAGFGYQATEIDIKLSGWKRLRRVVLIRRMIFENKGPVDDANGNSTVFEGSETARCHGDVILLTDLRHDIYEMVKFYDGCVEAEKYIDAVKNQWTWGGYTTQDLKRCRLTSRMVALVYNWWLLFVDFNTKGSSQYISVKSLFPDRVTESSSDGQQIAAEMGDPTEELSEASMVRQVLNKFLNYLKGNAS